MGFALIMFGFAPITTSSKIVMAFSASASASVSMTNNVKAPRTMPPRKAEVFKSMEEWARAHILPLAKPIQSCWQPQDFLPDPSSEGFEEQVAALRERARDLPDEYLVVLAGDLVTEEALPSYQTMVNRADVVADETGVSQSPWAVWSRAWTGEENRHGDLLNKYLYLSGRVDMRQVEKTIQYLIADGLENGAGKNPYLGLIYTSFQERATFISHANTAKLARTHGDPHLARICTAIAADEKRHETAYTNIVSKLFELDPDETVACLADMMRRKIAMPAYLMRDGRDPQLFRHFAAVASRIGVYTVMDYVGVLEHLVGTWGVEKLTGLSGEGRAAQDYVCGLGPRMRKYMERTHDTVVKDDPVPFSWVYGREV